MEVWEQPAATPGFHKIWEFRLCSAAQHNGKTSPDFFDNFSFGVLHFPNCERRASREIWAGHYADSCVQWDGRPALHHHTGGNSCADLWLIKRYAADRQRHCTASDGEYNNDRAYNHERLASRCLSAGSDAASLEPVTSRRRAKTPKPQCRNSRTALNDTYVKPRQPFRARKGSCDA